MIGRKILIGLSLTCCAHAAYPEPPVPIGVDPVGFWRTEELYDLKLAQQEWNKACGYPLFQDGASRRIPARTSARVVVEKKTSLLYGWGGPAFGILLYSVTPEDVRVPVLRHELGHALGLHHTDTGVMRHEPDATVRITQDDCDAVFGAAASTAAWVPMTPEQQVVYQDKIEREQ